MEAGLSAGDDLEGNDGGNDAVADGGGDGGDCVIDGGVGGGCLFNVFVSGGVRQCCERVSENTLLCFELAKHWSALPHQTVRGPKCWTVSEPWSMAQNTPY